MKHTNRWTYKCNIRIITSYYYQKLTGAMIQRWRIESSASTVAALMKGSLLPEESTIRSLSPYLENGMIHLLGRIERAMYIPESMKYPILLPRKHKIRRIITQTTFIFFVGTCLHSFWLNNKLKINKLILPIKLLSLESSVPFMKIAIGIKNG